MLVLSNLQTVFMRRRSAATDMTHWEFPHLLHMARRVRKRRTHCTGACAKRRPQWAVF